MTYGLQNSFALKVIGDGTTSSISIDLTNPPVDANFKGNEPVAVDADASIRDRSGNPITGSFAINKNVLTVSFAVPLAAGEEAFLSFILLFNGV